MFHVEHCHPIDSAAGWAVWAQPRRVQHRVPLQNSNSRPGRKLTIRIPLVFSVMLHFVAFCCNPRPCLTRRRSIHIITEFSFQGQALFSTRSSRRWQRPHRRSSGITCNLLQDFAPDFNRRPAACFAPPALARAALNRCGASPDRAFGVFSARPAGRSFFSSTAGPPRR